MAVESGLDVVVKGKDELTPSLADIQSKLIRFVGAVSSALAAIKIAAFPVDSVRDFEKEMAGVQKTTGFTDSQIKNLGDSLINLSRNINVSATDLAKIAAAAGQQGLGREGVEGVRQFTESVSRMASVLDITVEEAGTNVGKIASIFKIPLKEIENAASAFNEVSNNSTASGEQLLDVVKRIGDAAGSLNLQQSIGLSATGIDLGLSPEVVGSSFQKVFAEMYARADQFSKLLGVSVDDWIKGLQTNGIDALKQYLAGLRKLTPQAQQETIKALSGGGRIGSLVTKLLQDTEDTVLDTNVTNAEKGIRTGTSAIKEQETVLKTLDAQILKAGNSFKALGIIAGEEFAPRLAAYFKQLNDTLANPKVIEFAKAVGQAFLDMFDTIAGGLHYLSDLGIQWTNFVTIAKVLVAIKVAQVFSGFLTGIPLVTAAWNRLSGAAVAAGDAQAAAGGAGAGVIAAQVAKLKELIAGRQNYIATLEAERAAIQANAEAQAAIDAAQLAHARAGSKVTNAINTLSVAGAGISSAKAGVAAAEAQAAASQQAVIDQRNARIEEAQRAHATRMAQIEVESVRLQSIARAEGSAADVAAVKAAADRQIAIETTRNARSIAEIRGYYTQRLNIVTAAGLAEVNAAKAGLAASLSEFDGVAKVTGLTQLTTESEAAALALRNAEAAAVGANAQLTLSQRATALAARGFNLAQVAVRGLAAGFQVLISIAGRVFFWVSILYTVLEATGTLSKVTELFGKLTDAMGITEASSRDLEAQHRKTIAAQEALKKSADDAAEAIERLGKLQDQDTGQLSDKTKAAFQVGLSSKDRDAYLKTFNDVVQAASDAQAKIDKLEGDKGFQLVKVDDLEAQKKAVLAKLEEMRSDYAGMIKRGIGTAAEYGDGTAKAVLDKAQAAIKDQQALADKITQEITDLSGKNAESISNQIEKTKNDLTTLQDFTAKAFTPESAQIFENFAKPYLEAVRAKKAADDEYYAATNALADAQAKDLSEDRKKDLQDDIAAARAKQQSAEGIRQDIKTGLAQDIEAIKKTGGLSEATVGSLEALTNFLDKGDSVIVAILKGLGLVRDAGKQFTGELAAPPKTPAQGTNTFNPESESELRRQRKARADIVRAGLEAEANLQKEYNQQTNDDNEDAYKQNTKSIRDYYAERLKLQQENLAIEMNLQRNQIANLQDELGQAATLAQKTAANAATPEDADKANAQGNSEQLRIQAQIVQAEGQLKVLQAQNAALPKDTSRALRDAVRNFNDQVIEQKEALANYFGTASDQDTFNVALEAASAKYRDFVDRLRAESKDMPQLLPMINDIELQAKLEAVGTVIEQISRKSAIATGYLDITAQKITALGDAGILTRAQVATLEEKNRQAIIKVQEAEVNEQQAFLDAWVEKEGAAVKTSAAYQELQLQLDQSKAKIDLLKIQGDKVAVDLDKSFTNTLADSFKSLYGDNNGNIAKAIEDFFVGVLNTLADKASESLADTLYSALSSAISEASGGASTSLGSLFAPVFKDKDATLGTATGAAKNAAQDATTTVPTESFFSEVFDGLGDKIQGFGSSLYDGVASVGSSIIGGLSEGINSLIGFIGPLFSSLIAAVGGSGASQGVGAAVGAIAAAHNGGVAGATTMKRTGISPGAFVDAVRYHTGGKAGLAPNEVPVILEKGEEVLTREDPRHQDNLGNGTGGQGADGTGGSPIFNVQPVLSEAAVLDALKGSKGQQTLIVQISKNPAAFRSALRIK